MMAASRGLPVPLMIMCLVFFRGFSFLPTTSGHAGISPKAPWLTPEDYELEEDVSTVSPRTRAPVVGPLKPCDYKPCLENQVPCAELAASTRCLCPGFTLHTEIPDEPDLRSVSWNGSEVVVRWCAPNSYITAYHVTVGGQERRRFGRDQRSGGVGAIEDVSQVCLVAVNNAGASRASCKMYRNGDSRLSLRAGLIGGALGLLLLTLLLVLLLRRKRQRKEQAAVSMHEAAGAQWAAKTTEDDRPGGRYTLFAAN